MKRSFYLWFVALVTVILLIVPAITGCGASVSNSSPAPDSAAPTTPIYASAPSTGGMPQEGIKVHGRWTIEVSDPDGTLRQYREFDNALENAGSRALAEILSRQNSVGGWLVQAGAQIAADSPFMDPDSPVGLYGWITESTHSSIDPWVFKNLTVSMPSSGDNAYKVVLSGTATAQRDGIINRVSTGVWRLNPSSPPASSYSGSSLGFTYSSLADVPVSEGQVILITVVISFS